MPSEFEIIQRYFSRPARHALLGVGDDAALLRTDAGAVLAVATDMLLEGRHFAKGAEAVRVAIEMARLRQELAVRWK